MAYSATALTSDETTGFDADKPMLVVQSALSPGDAHWTFGGSAADTDKTSTSTPASRAYDDIGSLITEPTNLNGNVTGATQANPCQVTSNGHGLVNGDMVYLTAFAGGMTELNDKEFEVTNKSTNTFDLLGIDSTSYSAYSSAGKFTTVKYYNFYWAAADVISFDTLCILGHNLNSLGAVSVSLEIADNSTFSSNLIEIAKYTISGTTDNRILITNLNSAGTSSTYSGGGTAQRYRSVRYARLKILHATSDVPEVGEIFLGTRYQLQRNPDVPWNNKDERSDFVDFVSSSGLSQRYVFYRGQSIRTVEMTLAASANITTVESWFNDINEGTRPFLWVDTPSSSAEARIMFMDEASLTFPLAGPFERKLSFSLTEQPPFLSRE